MKTQVHLLLVLATLSAAFSPWAHGQGSGIVNFANNGATDDRRVWAWEGQLVRAAGTGYQVALYWGQQGTPELGLVRVGNPAGFLTGTAAGQFVGGNRTLTPLANNGAVVTLQARGWAIIPGVENSYEAVLAAGMAGDSRARIGKGLLFDHKSKDPNNPQELATPVGNNPDWQGFLIGIPEPSTLSLVTVGLAALIVFGRGRKGRTTSSLLLLTTAATLVGSGTGWAQGTGIINFANNGAADDRRIWVYGPGGETRAAGSAYQIALYWGNQGTPEQALVQVGNPVGFLTGTAAGQFVGGNRTLNTVVNGAVVTVQARAWAQIPGVPNSYEAVLAAGLGGVARGPVFDVKSKDPTNPQELATPLGNAAGWRGFAIIVPEPSTITLGAVGSALLLLAAWRSRKRAP